MVEDNGNGDWNKLILVGQYVIANGVQEKEMLPQTMNLERRKKTNVYFEVQ